MALARVWRNCIERGTQKLGTCPIRYRRDVVKLLQDDYKEEIFTKNMMTNLINKGMLTAEEYQEITGEAYEA